MAREKFYLEGCCIQTGVSLEVIAMLNRRRASRPPQWPFWLLLAAWFCANCPQVAIRSVLVWMAEAHSFTHQQRLANDVARVLSGEKPTSPIVDSLAQADGKIPPKHLPTLPADAAVKKIELSLEQATEVLPLDWRPKRLVDVAWLCPEPLPCPPPRGRPRALNTV